MTSDATRERTARLADQLEAKGALTSPYWRQALFEVPRHLFVPDQAWACPLDSDDEHLIDRGSAPEAWWDAVYSADLAIAAQVPGCSERLRQRDDGTATFELHHPDGSAEVDFVPGQETFTVRQYGPRRLWDEVTNAYLWWLGAGRPDRDRFGLTITPQHQYIWLDHPDSQYRWEIPP